MFRWLQALITIAIIMATAFFIARVGSDLYDRYNVGGSLTLIGLLFGVLCIISLAEGLWTRLRHSKEQQD